MVLDHVTQLAGLVEVTPATFNTDFFSHGDFNVGDMALLPLGTEQGVGKAQCDQVLNRLFSQVMVDAINLAFLEEFTDLIVDLAGGFMVVTDGFFQYHASLVVQAATGVQIFTGNAIERGG